MSVWTNVHCVMKFPEPVTAEELEKAFGKELNLKFISSNGYYRKTPDGFVFDDESYRKSCKEADIHNKREWKLYKNHANEYLPTGSEGSLEYIKCRRAARKTDDGKYKYEIAGALRDYDDDEGVMRWFRNRFLAFTNKHKDWTFSVYGCVSASSGVGEVRWTYGEYSE